jgi:putative oxidoreductase
MTDQTTTILPPSATRQPEQEKVPPAAHAGVDFGLFLLRLVLGGTMVAHGLQKVFGLFGGPGINGFAESLRGFGFHGQVTVLSWVTGISELAGGALLVFGLLTPVAAAALLGVAANAVFVKWGNGFFASPGGGFELELVLSVLAFSFLFTGPGRIALDRGRRWYTYAPAFGLIGLLFAAGATAAIIVLYH